MADPILDAILNTNPAPPVYTGTAYAAPANSPASQAAQRVNPGVGDLAGIMPALPSPNLASLAPDPTQQSQQQVQAPGGLKGMLKGFLWGMSRGMMAHAGIESPEQHELKQRQLDIQNRQAASLEGLRSFQQKVGEFGMDQVPVFNPFDGTTQMVSRKDAPGLLKAITTAQGNLAGKRLQFGPGLPLDEDLANLSGHPELAGQSIPKNQFDQVVKSISAKGYQIKDFGNEGQWLVDRTGTKIKRVGNSSAMDRVNALGPRMSVAMVNGVPTFVPNSQAGGLPAANLDPGAAARKAGAVAFSTGTEGDQIQSFRAFAGHANDLDQFSQSFAQSAPALASKPLNWLRKNADTDPAISAYLAKIDPVKKEFETFLLNNRALYESDRKTADQILNENMPASQMHSAINSFMHTAAIRMGSLNAKYRDLYGQDSPTMIDPETKRILQRFGQLGAFNAYDTGTAPSAAETKVWQGHTYSRKGPGQPWILQESK